MKKILMGILLIVMIPFVAAMDDIEVDCDGPGWFNTPICMDYELQGEFSIVTDAISQVEQSISTNQQQWSSDNSGMSDGSLSYFLWGEKGLFDKYEFYGQYIQEERQKELELVNRRIDKIEATQSLFLKMMMNEKPRPNTLEEFNFFVEAKEHSIRANRLGVTQYFGNFQCNPNWDECIGLMGVK